jgi:hypothetical protein
MLSLREPRSDLPARPPRMRQLPIDARGYPVPWFVQWIDGKPDFRVMDRAKWVRAVRFGNCWLCGETIGKRRTFVIGPMCAINRTTSEPACHHDCAEFAVAACPFMVLPRAKRREAHLPDHYQQAAGIPFDRNPGAMCLWTTLEFSLFRAGGKNGGNEGHLIRIGEPSTVEWYAEGREATRDEVLQSIDGGFPLLQALAAQEGQHALAELDSMMAMFSKFLPQ